MAINIKKLLSSSAILLTLNQSLYASSQMSGDHDRQGVSESAYLPPIGNSAALLQALESIPVAERSDTLRAQLEQLVTPSMNIYNCKDVIQSLLSIPNDERAAFIAQVGQLVTYNMGGYHRTPVIAGFARIPAIERAIFIDLVRQLVTDDMKNDNRADVIAAFANMPAAERNDTFIVRTQRLIPASMSGDDRQNIIRELAHVSSFIRIDTFVDQLERLITPDMDHFACRDIICALSRNIRSVDEREIFIRQVERLITPAMKGHNRAYIIRLLADSTDREGLIAQVERFITPDTDGYRRGIILYRFSRLDVAELEILRTQVEQLFTDSMSGNDRAVIIAGFPHLPVTERDAFIRQVRLLITDNMNGDERVAVMSALARIPAAERTDTFIAQVRQLLTPIMNAYNQKDIMETLAGIPVGEQRDTFVAQIRQLIEAHANTHANIDGNNLITIIRNFANIPAVERTDAIIAQVTRLMRPNMNLFDHVETRRLLARGHISERSQWFSEQLDRLCVLAGTGPMPVAAARHMAPAFDVHSYAANIDYPAIGVLLQQQLPAGVLLPSIDEARTEVEVWVRGLSDLDEATQMTWISALNQGYAHECEAAIGLYLQLSYAYVRGLNNPVMTRLWLNGFLGEAATAYDYGDPESCANGVRERVILGLRDVCTSLPESDQVRAILKLFARADLIKSYESKDKFIAKFIHDPTIHITWPAEGELTDAQKKTSWLQNVRTCLENEALEAGLTADQTGRFIADLQLQANADAIEWSEVINPAAAAQAETNPSGDGGSKAGF